MLSMFESIEKVSQSSHVACIIRQQAIAQLLSQGAWSHAVYVAMQMHDDSLRASAVNSILQASRVYMRLYIICTSYIILKIGMGL